MRVRLGIWHNEVAVFFDHDPGVPIEIVLEPDARMLYLTPDLKHGVPAYNDNCRHYNNDGYTWRVDAMYCEREGFSRCSLMYVDLLENPAGWHAHLLPNHLLPWPVARDCPSYSRAEELMRECIIRKDSANQYSEHMPPPPRNIQMELTPDMRVALFS